MSLDAHCHLEDPRLAGDLPAVLERAAAAGVHGGILAGYGPERWSAQAELARQHPSWHPCFGLHPWRLAEPGEPFELLEGLPAFLEEAVGLGELGLDRSPRLAEVAWDLQVAVFRAQLALARERDLPVVLHLVRATGAAREILHRDGLPRAGGMVHAFAGPREVARTWLDMGLHLSFGSLRGRAAESAPEVPGSRLLVETDAPTAPPRGRPPCPGSPPPSRTSAASRLERSWPAAKRTCAACSASRRRAGNPARGDPPVSPVPPLHARFERIVRLVGREGLDRLAGAHVLVLGLGGVGSWAAESLARTGVGRLTLVDFDRVCITNTNRQLPALDCTVGRPKCEVLAERLRLVSPEARVEGVEVFYGAATADDLLARHPDFVLDAIDHITSKCHLLATCRERGIPVVTSTGASGRLDPTRVRVADLARTRVDPMALAVRKILRLKYGFPPKKAFGIPAVYSEEEPAMPLDPRGEPDPSPGDPDAEEEFSGLRKRVTYGNASFVTGTFGLMAASLVVRGLLP